MHGGQVVREGGVHQAEETVSGHQPNPKQTGKAGSREEKGRLGFRRFAKVFKIFYP